MKKNNLEQIGTTRCPEVGAKAVVPRITVHHFCPSCGSSADWRVSTLEPEEENDRPEQEKCLTISCTGCSFRDFIDASCGLTNTVQECTRSSPVWSELTLADWAPVPPFIWELECTTCVECDNRNFMAIIGCLADGQYVLSGEHKRIATAGTPQELVEIANRMGWRISREGPRPWDAICPEHLASLQSSVSPID